MLKLSLNATIAIFALLFVGTLVNRTSADAGGVVKTAICHATQDVKDGVVHYNFLELPPEPLDDHVTKEGVFKAQHEQDFFPVDGDCDKTNDGGVTGTPDPGATPEPITILLFGAGVAGVGYASRRLRRNRSESDQ